MKAKKNQRWMLLVVLFFILVFFACCCRNPADKMTISSIVEASEKYVTYYDIQVTLSWDNLYCNMDLYVKEPTGETASPWNPLTSIGGETGYYDYDTEDNEWVYGDSGTGIGRETYRLEKGRQGIYEITVYSPGLSGGGTAKTNIFVIMNEGTHVEQYASFAKEIGLGGETWWSAGSFDYYPIPGSGDCFISTAAYGTPLAQEVRTLCLFRDRYLMANHVGRTFIKLYETVSPPFSRVISGNKWLMSIVRIQLTPVVALSRFILNL